MKTGASCVEHPSSMPDKAFAAQLQSICEVLNTSGENSGKWGGRLEALRQLEVFSRADMSNRRDFMMLMNTFVKVPLQKHIEEDRAALSNEACRVVTSLAKHCSNRRAWQAVSEWFIQPLLRITVRKKKVFVDAAVETLCNLARTNSFGPRAFAELLRGCTAAHAATRSYTFSVLQLFIQQCKNNEGEFALSPYLGDVCRVLRSGLSDADAQTRRCARDCYWNFRSAEAEAAETLYNKLEAPVKRMLGQDRNRLTIEKMVPKIDRNPTTAATPASKLACGTDRDLSTPPEEPGAVEAAAPAENSKTKGEPEAGGKATEECGPDALLESLSSSAWEERLRGVRRVVEDFPYLRHKEECVKLLVVRLNDSNGQVALAALEVLPLVFRLAPLLFKALLPELITSLLINVSERKGFSGVSRRLLVSTIRANSIDDVMDAIYCELRRIVSPSLKVHALEYAKYLYIDNAVHFAQLTPMRRAVEELLPIIQTEGPHNLVRKSAASALTALYVTSKGTFIRVLSHHLSPSDCESIVDELQLAIPHLGQECRRTLAGQKPLPHPVPVVRCAFADILTKEDRTPPKDANAKELTVSKSTDPGNATHSTIQRPSTACAKGVHDRPPERRSNKRYLGERKVASPAPMDRRRSPMGRTSNGDGVSPLRGKGATHHVPMTLPYALPIHGGGNDYSPADLLEWLDRTNVSTDTRDILDAIAFAIAKNPSSWGEVFNRLLVLLERLIPDSCEPSHTVRFLALKVLHTVVGSGVLRQAVNRSLKRILLLVRAGIDDVFPEVHMDAAAVLHLIINSGLYSTDHLLNAVAMTLDTWLRSNKVGYSTRGWLTMLEAIKHIFFQLGCSAVLVPCAFKEYAELKDTTPGVVSEPVLHRVCSTVVSAVQHSVPEVRLTAVVACVAIWMTFDTAALPYFVDLTASQRKLISMYFTKLADVPVDDLKITNTERDMTSDMRAAGLPYATHL
ncbi:hypothetical protein, conserved [Trypanosoma brucei gambiense DAL972]|uniref:CLASP N-terminal domain-containing protein n=2 Tax=Trypanosoma brucei TaxID=5691 RepID=D0A9W5_TRYB9|nr:hypothetical protein, conserved [Trypanosoma brucei gambiense DAL972]CBH18466.1 hypothetical protein, conserved [Trypanosoma brucei gambiense DAL972]|eukprot:XP_011780730.1 hypothetical protein, conserved [Trypanosoma brucei gambiense DAL972]